ncbi:MAG: preprotein translocase subunit SecA [Rickettsiales bacterium]|jgi:preprotein translocase subunit SecA|nr:preprotein translocase subunit SecA [Rickettsiales bacterium]
MLGNTIKKIFGSSNERALKKEQKTIDLINQKENHYSNLSDIDLKHQTSILKERLAKGETLDDILPDAFAVTREAAKRTLKQRHYDVQLLGGIFIHKGTVVEMKTGEGKTLVSTLPIYLNALSGKGVHVVTVNEYLAERDSKWMGQIYEFLGLTVNCIKSGQSDEEKQAAYKADITYGTNSEFGFDYLRDNMKHSVSSMAQRPLNFAIIDEVDSILIDEARTPLIISGAGNNATTLYVEIDKLIPQFKKEHYKKDEKDRNVMLTEEGTEFAEKLLSQKGLLKSPNLYDLANADIVHHLDQALLAHILYQKNVDYLVKDNEVFLIDAFTGRIMDGRRFSNGLHQALEAKEHVAIQQENQTVASISYQNYFRMYPKISGMTGTALTEADEFFQIYKLNCIEVPTNKPVARIDHQDEIYRTSAEKYKAIAHLVKECHERQQPVLIGTVSIEKSELLSNILEKEYGIKNISVLNAKFHEKEAQIVANAGIPGSVTIATNMAGRGTDIQLGGNEEVLVKELGSQATAEQIKKTKEKVKKDKEIALKAGGLYVIGTERHESRRIDNQLRGRSGRQGDVGASKFFLSLDDDLMRIFGADRLNSVLNTFGLKEGEAITHRWISKALEKAQQKVEAHNFDIRKNLIKYDDIINEQRKIIYDQRLKIMKSENLDQDLNNMIEDVIDMIISRNIPENSYPDQWNVNGIDLSLQEYFNLKLPIQEWTKDENIKDVVVYNKVLESVKTAIAKKKEKYSTIYNKIEKIVFLEMLDNRWKDYLSQIDALRKSSYLQQYGQKDPLQEYQKESFKAFQEMLSDISLRTVSTICRMEFDENALNYFEGKKKQEDLIEEQPQPQKVVGAQTQVNIHDAKIGRNEQCPCNSGKKYKHCCGKIK